MVQNIPMRLWIAVGIIFLTPLTSNLPRGFPVPFFVLNEIILMASLVLLLVLWLTARPQERKALWRTSWLDPLFALLFLSGTLLPLFGYLVTGRTMVPANIVRLFDLVQFFLLYRILMLVVDDTRKLSACALALVAAGVIIASIGMLEALNVPPVRQLIETYYPSFNLERNIAIGYPRVLSLMGAPQAYAAFLSLNIFLCLTLLLYSAAEIPRRFVGLALVICLLGFIPSGGYSAMLGAAFMFGLLLFFYRRLPGWVWLSGALALAIGGIVFSEQIFARLRFQFRQPGSILPATLVERVEHWKTALSLLKPADWLFGYPGVRPPELFSVENQYIHLIFRGGILYLLAYVFVILRVLIEAYRTYRIQAGICKSIALCTFIVIAGFSIMGMSDSYFAMSGVGDALWTLVSLTAVSTFVQKSAAGAPVSAVPLELTPSPS